ncbi:MAG: hypothetical protein RLO50_08575 [Azospirillaceae bacterium]
MSEGSSPVGDALEQVAADIGSWAGAEIASVQASVERKASVAVLSAIAGTLAVAGLVLIMVGGYVSLAAIWPAWTAGLFMGGAMVLIGVVIWAIGHLFVGRHQKRLARQRAKLAQRLVRSDLTQIGAVLGALKDERIAIAAAAALLAGLAAGRRSR